MAVLLALLSDNRSPASADPPAVEADLAGLAVVAVILNGRDTGNVIEVVQRPDGLYARRGDLRAIGLLLPPGDERALVRIDGLPGVQARYDSAAAVLSIDAGQGAVLATRVGARDSATPALSPVTGVGVVLNYDLQFEQDDRSGPRVAGAFEAGVSRGPLAARTTVTVSAGDDIDTRVRRLETVLSYSDPGGMRVYRVGDVISGGLDWSRPVRMGGVQIASDFSMRPDLVTFPVPRAAGTAAVPTTVSVLVDGVERLSQKVGQGPFEIPRLPVMGGANQVSVVTQDALGRQVVQQLPFYASPLMLAPGLQAFSAELGWVRRDFGLASDRYTGMAASATLRRGISDWVTGEAHAEAAEGLLNAGLGATFRVGALGTVSLAGSASRAEGQTGALYSVAVDRTSRNLSFGASIQHADSAYRDIAAINGEPEPRTVARARFGFRTEALGSLGAGYAEIDWADRTDTRLVTLSWQRALGERFRLFATGYRDLRDTGGTGGMLSLSLALGGGKTASASATAARGQRSATIQASDPVTGIGSWGWRGAVSAEEDRLGGFGELRYRAAVGEFGIGVDRGRNRTVARATAEGSLVVAHGGVFASNRIIDSYAVIDTDGQAGIDVYVENRRVGQTNSAGLLLAPELRAFEANRVSIDLDALPLDATVSDSARMVVPYRAASTVVRFPIERARAVRLSLVDASGTPLPAGSLAQPGGGGAPVPIGYGGDLYLPMPGAQAILTVDLPAGGKCRVTVTYPAHADALPNLGRLACQ
ncbi:fimbria/pilus outer membrane usher protein [Sphingomonas sp. HITSZ_GF]|uniref:fimbria/pilus outer membrane usher protein n=1 Tax=Sphingomonas sp. HITSZ_GF TaxID=3037247 RepID=UPI00240DAFC5|nr:fimbria/pilus outer membrane usher protein [Sphingomonas sp. HITSZ_GF]MDG2535913.1 fimbria/pilus outer membrane usher protein [Sphingomonas sp. HITSZ_GF]